MGLASLPDTFASPNFFNSSLLPWSWWSYVKPVKALHLKTAHKHAVEVQALVSLHICVRDPYKRAWFRIVKELAREKVLCKVLLNSEQAHNVPSDMSHITRDFMNPPVYVWNLPS